VIRIVRGLSGAVGRAPALVVAGTVLLTVVLAVLANQVRVAVGNEGFAPDKAEIAAAETLGDRFTGSGEEVVQIIVEGPDIVSPDGLRAVEAITAAITADAAEHLSERSERPAVVSWLSGMQQAAAVEGIDVGALDPVAFDRLFVETLAAAPPEQASRVSSLLADGSDVESGGAESGLVLVFMDVEAEPGSSVDAQWDQLITAQIDLADAALAADLPRGFSADAFSFPLLFADDGSFDAELTRLFVSAFAIILLILGAVFWLRPGLGLTRLGAGRRTVADVALTMATIVMAITWMNGAAALLGPGYLGLINELTPIAQVVPVLLIGLGVDYSIHLTSRYREELGAGADVTTGIRRAVHAVGIALALATVTTAVGFLTNVINPIPALRDFGVLAAVGIVSAFLLMLTFVPAVRLLLDRRAERLGRVPARALGRGSERLLPGVMARTAVLAERTPFATLAVTVLLGGALGAWGLANLETRFSSTDFVSEDSPILGALDTITERFGGGFGETTEVLLGGDMATPAAHNAMVAVTAELTEVDGVVAVGGHAQAESVITLLGSLLAPPPMGAESPPAIPTVAEAAAAAGLGPDLTVPSHADVAALYAALLDAVPEEAARVLATDDAGRVELARVAIQTTAGEAGAGALAADLDAAFAPVAALGTGVVATSNPIINHVIVEALQSSQVSSMLVTLLAAMALLMASFWARNRRPALGVLTTLPVMLVVLWTFGMMAATDIPFGPITATIAALAIGIGVPYSIHITNRFLEDRELHEDPRRAIRSTVRHTGGALAGSALTTCAGFGVLVTSSLVPFRQLGLVTVYAVGFALLAATLVLPSLLALWDRWHRRRIVAQVVSPAESGRPAPALTE
jgi:uncharacterized protein